MPFSFVLRLSVLALCLLLCACNHDSACNHDLSPQDVSIAGMVPALDLRMQDVNTGKPVTAADFRGKVTLVYFGYTNCPDVCPATLYNVDKILRRLGPLAAQVSFLFVTVDPDRDSAPVLAQYVGLFGPDIIGLRGNPDQLFALARRYRVVFSVTRPTATTPYEVTHSAAIYVFDTKGRAQFLIAGLDSLNPDIPGITADLRNLIQNPTPFSWLDRLTDLISAS
jgi:protein SCO1/2